MSLKNTLSEHFDKQLEELDKVNLMVVGGTGVGKSSLINRVFGKKVAETGSGEPITRGCEKYEDDSIPVVIYDSEGYEIINGSVESSNFVQNVISEIDRLSKLELKHHIHLFWYCISANNHRITDYDIENIKALRSRNAELAIVITQCDEEELDENGEGITSKAFKKVLKDAGIDNKVFETSATLEDPLDLPALLEWSAEALPTDKLKDAFIGAQKSNLEIKDKQAQKAILAAAATAATAAGANPFPLSDSVALASIQLALAARLANIYGFKALDASVMALLKSQLLTLIGRQLAASLTKLIPVLGQVVNAGVASTLTAGLGYALNGVYKKAYKDLLETGKLPDWVALFSAMDVLSHIQRQQKKG